MSANTANPAGNLHGHCFTPDRRWSARMELDFAVRQGRTTLTKMQFSGPLRVQRPFYPEAAPVNAPGPSHWRARLRDRRAAARAKAR